MKEKYWLIGGISSIAFVYFLNLSYQSFLSKNFSAASFDFATAQAYQFWIFTLSSVGSIATIVGAILVAFQKSSRNRWHSWYRLLAAGFLLSVIWAIVGASVQTLTGDVLFWLGYQKPAISNYSPLEQLLQANNWREADGQTSSIIREISATRIVDPKISSFSRLPCADFQTIDRLWVKYSSGRFGFSVQRRIYENINVPKSNSSTPLDDKLERMELFLKEVKLDGMMSKPKFSRDDAIGVLPSLGIWLSTPVSQIRPFAAEESMERQKWCGF